MKQMPHLQIAYKMIIVINSEVTIITVSFQSSKHMVLCQSPYQRATPPRTSLSLLPLQSTPHIQLPQCLVLILICYHSVLRRHRHLLLLLLLLLGLFRL